KAWTAPSQRACGGRTDALPPTHSCRAAVAVDVAVSGAERLPPLGAGARGRGARRLSDGLPGRVSFADLAQPAGGAASPGPRVGGRLAAAAPSGLPDPGRRRRVAPHRAAGNRDLAGPAARRERTGGRRRIRARPPRSAPRPPPSPRPARSWTSWSPGARNNDERTRGRWRDPHRAERPLGRPRPARRAGTAGRGGGGGLAARGRD